MKRLIVAMLATGALSAAVEDRAALFSPAAVTAANKKLADIRTSTAKEIVILTTNDLEGKSIGEYARNQAYSRKLNGVIVVISTKPRMLEIVPGRKTSLVFNRENVQKVIMTLRKNLAKSPDAALGEAVNIFYDVFKAANAGLLVADSHQNAPRPAARTESGSGGGWLKWLVIIGVVLLIVRLISYFMSRNANQAATGTPGAPPAPGGFSGFFPSLMGGIFGAVAGSWIYDKFFSDHEDRSYHANDSHRDDSWRGDDNGDSGSGSGSDWGNGDSGSGGGDSGGGGDW